MKIRKFLKYLLPLIIILVFGQVSFSKNGNPVIGCWRSTNSLYKIMLVFNKDNTFILKILGINKLRYCTGSYNIKNDTIYCSFKYKYEIGKNSTDNNSGGYWTTSSDSSSILKYHYDTNYYKIPYKKKKIEQISIDYEANGKFKLNGYKFEKVKYDSNAINTELSKFKLENE